MSLIRILILWNQKICLIIARNSSCEINIASTTLSSGSIGSKVSGFLQRCAMRWQNWSYDLDSRGWICRRLCTCHSLGSICRFWLKSCHWLLNRLGDWNIANASRSTYKTRTANCWIVWSTSCSRWPRNISLKKVLSSCSTSLRNNLIWLPRSTSTCKILFAALSNNLLQVRIYFDIWWLLTKIIWLRLMHFNIIPS